MEIAFYVHDGKALDKVIKLWTAKWEERFNGQWRSLASHVEFKFSSGIWFSSSPRDGGTRFKYIEASKGRWVYFKINITKEEESILYNWCDSIKDKKYDWIGILSFIFPLIKDSEDKWFCSECIIDGSKLINKLTNFRSDKTSPREIMDYLYEQGYESYM